MATKLGQDTGAPPDANRDEAIKILEMIGQADWANDRYLSRDAQKFLMDQYQRLGGGGVIRYSVTGRQLFYLRDIKDRMIEKGLI